MLTDSPAGGSSDAVSMASDHEHTPEQADHDAELALDDIVGALYRDVAEWKVEVSAATSYGPAVVQRSVKRLIDEHVQRLRRHLTPTSPTDPQSSPERKRENPDD